MKVNGMGFSLRQWLFFSGMIYFLFTKNAYPDTYNLYFKEKPTAGTEEGTVTTPAQPKIERAEPAAATTPVKERPETIIINNNIQPTPAVVSPPPPPAPIEPPSPVVNPVTRSRPFKMGLSASTFSRHNSNFDAEGFRTNSAAGLGLDVSLGVKFSSAIAVNGWAGTSPSHVNSSRYHIGVDLELNPFKINMGSYDLFELGVLAGISNLRPNPSDSTPFHLGGRLTLNFNESLGITSSVRINSTYLMWDAGFVAYL